MNDDDFNDEISGEDTIQNGAIKIKDQKKFKCDTCKRSYKYKGDLDRHKLVHTNPFTCGVCHYKFSRLYHLERHSKIHASKKPFICTIFYRSFSRLGKLDLHLLNIHLKENIVYSIYFSFVRFVI